MTFIKSFKSQFWRFPSSIEELIPEDHVRFLVESFVEPFDYFIIEESCNGAGHSSYHPRVILKLLVIVVFDRIKSSRNAAQKISLN